MEWIVRTARFPASVDGAEPLPAAGNEGVPLALPPGEASLEGIALRAGHPSGTDRQQPEPAADETVAGPRELWLRIAVLAALGSDRAPPEAGHQVLGCGEPPPVTDLRDARGEREAPPNGDVLWAASPAPAFWLSGRQVGEKRD